MFKGSDGTATPSESPLPSRRSSAIGNIEHIIKVDEATADVVDFEKDFYQDAVKKDLYYHTLLSWPSDEVLVQIEKRQRRTSTIDPSLPATESSTNSEYDPYIIDCVDFFKQDWLKIKRKFEETQPITSKIPSLKKLDIEGIEDNNNLVSSSNNVVNNESVEADEVDSNLYADYKGSATDSENNKLRQQNRNNIFALTLADPPSSLAKPPKKSVPYSENLGKQVMIEVKKITFAIGEVEPYFGILAVYDIVKRKKITENFYFEVNNEENAKMMDPFQQSKDPITTCKKCIFSITEPNTDMFLVLRIEKVLQGDLDNTVEPYLKQTPIKDKDKDKLKSGIKEVVQRLGNYRQPFCWGMIPLFNDDLNSLVAGEGSEFKPLYRQKGSELSDSILLELVNEYSKTNSSKRNKTVPGSCTVDVIDVGDSIPSGIVNPMLQYLNPLSKDNNNLVRELQEFKSANITSPYPQLEYVNNLYIYPESANLSNRGGSVGARNIAVKVQLLDTDENTSNPTGIIGIYGKSNSSSLVPYAFTTVTYHNKTPVFYDEFKIKLPLKLTEKSHLLFTFYHVTCQLNKATGKTEIETPVGYSVLPLYQNQKIVDKEHILPIALDLVPHYLSPDVESNLKYIDNKKPLFKLKCELSSTVYTTDKYLNAFLHQYHKKDLKSQKSKVLQNLVKVKPPTCIRFLPIILNELMMLIGTSNEEEATEAFLSLNQIIENVYNGFSTTISEPTSILYSYIDYVFSDKLLKKCTSSIPFHESLLKVWLEMVLKKNDQCVKFAWFFFRIMYKAMCLTLHSKNELNRIEPRSNLFSDSFTKNLKTLVLYLSVEIQQRSKTGINIAKELTRTLAYFIKSLFAIIDRKISLQLVSIVINQLTYQNDSEGLIELKFDFLALVLDYEQYVPLNLPLPHSNISNLTDIFEDFSKQHYLSGILMQQLQQYIVHKDKGIRVKCIITIKNILRCHEIDPRYQLRGVQQRIATTYFPVLLIIADHFDIIRDMDFDERRHLFTCYLYILRYLPESLLASWIQKETQSRLVGFFDILCQCTDVFEYMGEDKYLERMRDSKNSKTREAKTLLENFYTESGGKSSNTSASPLSGLGPKYRSLREKRAAQRNERKASDVDSRGNSLTSGILGGTSSSISSSTSTTTAASPSSGGGYGSLSLASRFGARSLSASSSSEKAKESFDEACESNLCSEVSFILLDTLESIIQSFDTLKTVPPIPLLENILKLWLALFKRNQSNIFLSSLYASSKSFVCKFGKQLFNGNGSTISELCQEVIKHMNSTTDSTRKQASSLLYLLMKKNFEFDGHSFTRVKVQTTISLSKLVGKGIKTDKYLRRSLATISKYVVTQGKNGNTSFAGQVEELTGRLHTILRDSLQINEHSSDPEMMADLYYRIAVGYKNAPDLRVAWLESLANFHIKNKNWAEASMCHIHIAALVAEYLAKDLTNTQNKLKEGAKSFLNVSDNILEETVTTNSTLKEEGLFDSKSHIFSEKGLFKLITDSIEYLKQAELFETASELYKIILSIYESKRDYDQLAKSHGDLKDIYNQIISSIQTQSRLLGSYYRVGFFGKLYEELDGLEFIYKEPKLTRIMEIKERLLQIYAIRFKGEDKIQIITDSGSVDRSKLNPNLAYIQITSVQPYFDVLESKERLTYFERNNNLRRFIFSTPFTMSGKSHAESVKEQYKRKTILTVGNTFPYVKRRVLIVSKQEVTMTPLENSIEAMESRTDAILSEIRTSNPNTKTLHPVLQGSLIAAVNAGPKEICTNFLGKNASEFPQPLIEKLKQSFRDFLKACEEALQVDKTIITVEQVDFHNELEIALVNLRNFSESLM